MDALHLLFKGVIDYAGMYPPARLSLATALANYLDYQQSPEAWMLGTLVVPVGELDAVGSMLHEREARQMVRLSVIGRGGTDPQTWRRNLREDFEQVEDFLHHHGALARLETFEARLPVTPGWEVSPHETSLRQAMGEGLPPPSELTGLVALALKELERFRDDWPRLYFEPPRQDAPLPAWYGALAEVASFLFGRKQDRCGLKLRLGGLEPAAVPSTRDVALFLQVCHTFETRWKGTAGLHRPLRSHDAALGVDGHGFVNLLMASVLMSGARLTQSPILILSDDNPSHFGFDGQACHWGMTDEKATADLAAIRRARTHGLCSFGSCDFDEPREQLRRLGWLPHA